MDRETAKNLARSEGIELTENEMQFSAINSYKVTRQAIETRKIQGNIDEILKEIERARDEGKFSVNVGELHEFQKIKLLMLGYEIEETDRTFIGQKYSYQIIWEDVTSAK